MDKISGQVEFVVQPVTATGGASEFRQSMKPHPLVHQELAHQPHFGLYNGRLRALSYADMDPENAYWQLRQSVMLAHTGELALEIRGPEAEALLDRVFTRRVSKVRVGRCSYQIACYPDGGMIMDGVLVRLAEDHFWYVQSDGEFRGWLRAQAQAFDATVRTTDIWISQVQGPRSLDVLAAVADGGLPEPFRYFDMARITIDGQPMVVTRTGFTSELGWEFYLEPGVDAEAIGARILEAGQAYGMDTTPAEVTNARRIEGGLLFAGTDFDETVTPYEAGLAGMVDLDKPDFVGKAALAAADQRSRTWGIRCRTATPQRGRTLFRDGSAVGVITSSSWSPTLDCGIAIIRLDSQESSVDSGLMVQGTDGLQHPVEVCTLPFFDEAGDLPRGRPLRMPALAGQA